MSIFSDFKKDVEKTFKKRKIVFGSDVKSEPVPTGSVVIDSLDGGIAFEGRISEISSYESGGKSTLALMTVAQALEKYPDKAVVYVDSELALDPVYMKSLGADPDDERLIVVQPNNIEEADKFLTMAFDSQKGGKPGKLEGKVSLLVIDSVASLRSKSEFDAEVGGSGQKSMHASAWGSLTIKINRWAKLNDMAVLLVNQFRAKPQISNMDKFSLSNTSIGQGYSNTDTSITTCVTYDTKVKVRVDGVEKEITMKELKDLMDDEDIVQVEA